MGQLPEPSEKAAVVRAMFDRIAPSYDRMNRLMTLGLDQRWRRAVVDELRVGPDDSVLDLACGTGDFAEFAAARGAHVVALDFSSAMLLGARKRRLPRTALVQADALRLPLADASVSVAISGFALRNFVAIPPVLAELARVLRPGGRLGLLEVETPHLAPLRIGHGIYFNHVVPAVGALLSDGRAYRYLPASAAYLPPEGTLKAMLGEAGFASIVKQRYAGGAAQSLTAVRP